ncbi:hypothetical protein I541_5641 [Mycobacteroides abscessus]|nr:hypothetical protein I541_5641 [Mycobacteroides abscessus]
MRRLDIRGLIERLRGNTEYVTFVPGRQLGDPRMRNNPVARKQVLSEDAPPGNAMAAWPATSVLHWRSGHFAPWMTW